MGSIRTFLAISVLIVHSGPIFGVELLNGDHAITCFFMISGFLMALILQEKYASVRRFYVNRALRIYPPYFFALLLSVAIFLAIPTAHHDPDAYLVEVWETGQLPTFLLGVVSNLTLIGIDLTRYISIENGVLQIPAFLYKKGDGAHNLLFVPQAWTLAVELQFYLLAPFVLRLRSRHILALALTFSLLRYAVYREFQAQDWPFDPGAFFPLVFSYFLSGVFAYRVYRYYRALALPAEIRRVLGFGALAAAFGLIFWGGDIIRIFDLEADGFYLLFALTLPFVFDWSVGRRWDAWLGEFSYPVYLLHFVLVQTYYAAALPREWVGEATLLSTLLLSAGYIYAIDRPIQRLRARIAAGAAARPERGIVEVAAR